ncbi:MAG: hypothetical protein HY675_08325 [Chloroflexi bacterium]|nr:hypothetical protein [Chloroflexota bacterium]
MKRVFRAVMLVLVAGAEFGELGRAAAAALKQPLQAAWQERCRIVA